MGPKGLEKYFQKHFNISWGYFLKTPSEVLEMKIVKGDAATPSARKRAKKTAKKTHNKGHESGSASDAENSKTPVESGKTVRSKKRTPMSVKPAQRRERAAEAKPMAVKVRREAASGSAPTIDYDKTEREMNELKLLLQQSIR
jgi:hypothetical protein